MFISLNIIIKRIVNSMSLMIFSYEDGLKITKIQKYEHLKLRRFIRKFGVLIVLSTSRLLTYCNGVGTSAYFAIKCVMSKLGDQK